MPSTEHGSGSNFRSEIDVGESRRPIQQRYRALRECLPPIESVLGMERGAFGALHGQIDRIDAIARALAAQGAAITANFGTALC